MPILLVREGGLWRVDLVERFKSCFFDNEGAYRLVNLASPYAQFAPAALDRNDARLSPVGLGPESLEAVVECLERSQLPRDRFRVAEILMRNCCVSAEAILLYAEAARPMPHDATIVLRYADRASYLFMPEIAVEAVKSLGPAYWTRVACQYESAHKPELAREYDEKALDQNPRDEYARAALERLAAEG